MATEVLVDTLAEEGIGIVARLEADDFAVKGAFWSKSEEYSPWILYLISPELESRGIGEAYRRLYRAVAEIHECPIPLSDIKLIGENEPMSRQAIQLASRHPGRASIQLADAQFGDRFVDSVYIYSQSALWGGPRLGFTVTYRRQGKSNVWEADVEQDEYYGRMRPKGAVTYTTVRWQGQTEEDENVSLVSVLVELGPELDNPSVLASKGIQQLLARQARHLADPMFLEHRPGAVIAPE